MRKFVRGVAFVLPLMLTACFHRHHKPVAPQSLAPYVQHTPKARLEPQAIPPQPSAALQIEPAKPILVNPPEQTVHKLAHRHHPENKNVEELANPTPEVSAIGRLSSGDPSDLRAQTESSLESTDRELKKINLSLSDPQQKTVAQIREFLKQARAALTSGDVDGAHTLALKARVLLDEIVH
ncbi:MAG TPA: hypothetical protein VMV57_12685 [Terracidiphilus sp.]|nr:hypothetical protein [Terracidiphilus sp.]